MSAPTETEARDLTPRGQRLTDLAQTLSAAAEQILQVVAESHHTAPSRAAQSIKGTVAGYFGVTARDLAGRSRHRRYAHPRRVAMYLMREMTDMTLDEVGQELRRDHTTVIYGVGVIKAEIARNPASAAQLESLRELLKAQPKEGSGE